MASHGDGTDRLRVLIANERKDRLALVADALGHKVIAREIEVEDVGPVTSRERPDVALVGFLARELAARAGPDRQDRSRSGLSGDRPVARS